MFHRCPVKRLTHCANVPSNRTFVASNVRVQEITHLAEILTLHVCEPYPACRNMPRFSLASPRNAVEYITVLMPSLPFASRGIVQYPIRIKSHAMVRPDYTVAGTRYVFFRYENQTISDFRVLSLPSRCPFRTESRFP